MSLSYLLMTSISNNVTPQRLKGQHPWPFEANNEGPTAK